MLSVNATATDTTAPGDFTPTRIWWYNAADDAKIGCVSGKVEDIPYGTQYPKQPFVAGGTTPHPQYGQFQNTGVACSTTSLTIFLDGDYADKWEQTATGKLLGPWRGVATVIRECEDGTFKFHVAIIVPPHLLHLWPKQRLTPFGHIKSNGFCYTEGVHASGTRYENTGKPWVVADERLMLALLADNGNVLHGDNAAGNSDDLYADRATWVQPDGEYPENFAEQVLGNWVLDDRNSSLPRRCGIIKAAGGSGVAGMGTLFSELCAEYDSATGRGDGDVYRAYERCHPAYDKANSASQAQWFGGQVTLLPVEVTGGNGHGAPAAIGSAQPVTANPAAGDVTWVTGNAEPPHAGNGLEGALADNRPPKPSADMITDAILKSYAFARDTGGELFLLPGPMLPDEPYIPRSFLTQEVRWLITRMWRELAQVWNGWVFEAYPDPEIRAKEKIKVVSKVANPSIVSGIVGAIEAEGMAHARKVSAELRSVQGNGYLIIDLGDATGQVVYVTAENWWVTDPRKLPAGIAPPVFRRSVGYFPLPAPVYGGDLDMLWSILRVTGPTAISLGTGWLVAAFFTSVSRPGIWATGVPGSGKTTYAASLARLADGVKWLRGKMDKNDERNNIIRAVKAYIGTYDNMTSVTAEQSDWLCNMVTGRVDTFRKMKTNFDDISVEYKRTFVATGLSLPYGLAADALERIIEVPCEPIGDSSRVGDAQIQVSFDMARPQILGAILDHVVQVLRALPAIPADKRNGGRMAEYADILTAHDMAYGTNCREAFMESIKTTKEEKAAGEPVVMAIEKLFTPPRRPCGQCPECVSKRACTSPTLLVFPWCKCTSCTSKSDPRPACVAATWKGTATELFTALSGLREIGGQISAYWPENARRLSDKITELYNVLAAAGFSVFRKPSKNKAATLTITRGWDRCV